MTEIDQELLEQYLEHSGRLARAGILNCGGFDAAMADGKTVKQYMREELERTGRLIPVNDWSDVPEFSSEREEQEFWETRCIGKKLLEQYTRVPADDHD